MVRYADDFKIFCATRKDADRAYHATKAWLQERLKLEISEEKSKIVNLKKGYSEFLGFKLTLMKKGASYVVKSHICDKAKRRETDKLKGQIKKIAHPKNDEERATLINEYNSMIMGMHNYFQIATCVSSDFADMGREVDVVKLSQLKRKALSAKGDYKGFSFIEKKYGKSKQIRFYSGKPLIPVAYVKHKNPMWKKKSVCKYTPEGRREIHKNLGIDTRTMLLLMRTKEVGRSVEYMDNRISLYVAQYGKCAITGKITDILVRAEDAAKLSRIVERLGLGAVSQTAQAEVEPIDKEIADSEALLEQILTPPEKEQQNPTMAQTESSDPSGRGSTSNNTATESRPSVRAALQNIRQSQKNGAEVQTELHIEKTIIKEER